MRQKQIFTFMMIILTMLIIPACSHDGPSELYFQGRAFDFKNLNDTTRGNFNIVEYTNNADQLILIIPHKGAELQDKLPGFSKLYTQTFKAQGFRFTGEGSRHIGIGKNHIVYIAVCNRLGALCIFLSPDIENHPHYVGSALSLFRELEDLR